MPLMMRAWWLCKSPGKRGAFFSMGGESRAGIDADGCEGTAVGAWPYGCGPLGIGYSPVVVRCQKRRALLMDEAAGTGVRMAQRRRAYLEEVLWGPDATEVLYGIRMWPGACS